MEYKQIEKNDVGYVSRLTGALKTAAIAGLAGLVIAGAGCARTASRGFSLDLVSLEFGEKSTWDSSPEVQQTTLQQDAKYQAEGSTAPGANFGIRYNNE